MDLDEEEPIEYEEVEEEPEEIVAREAVVEQSTSTTAPEGKRAAPQPLLTQLDSKMEKRVESGEPVFTSTIWKKKELETCLNDYFNYFLLCAAKNTSKLHKKDFPEQCASFKRIAELNEEILESLQRFGGLPKDYCSGVGKRNMKTVISCDQMKALVSERGGLVGRLHCEGVGHGRLDNGVHRYVVLEGCEWEPSEEGEEREKIEKKPICNTNSTRSLFTSECFDHRIGRTVTQVFPFCLRHLAIANFYFCLAHMQWNISMNAKYRITEVLSTRYGPDTPEELVAFVDESVRQSLVTEYMARYAQFLIFGSSKQLEKWGVRSYYYVEAMMGTGVSKKKQDE